MAYWGASSMSSSAELPRWFDRKLTHAKTRGRIRRQVFQIHAIFARGAAPSIVLWLSIEYPGQQLTDFGRHVELLRTHSLIH